MLICYIAGMNYVSNKIEFEGNEEFKAFEKEFETPQEAIEFAVKTSDLYSIPVQFYI